MIEKELRDFGKLYKPFGCEELRAEYVLYSIRCAIFYL